MGILEGMPTAPGGKRFLEEMFMNRIAGIVILVVGVVLIVWGLNASHSLGSGISKAFTGSPTNKSIYLLVGGALLSFAGAGVVFYPRDGKV